MITGWPRNIPRCRAQHLSTRLAPNRSEPVVWHVLRVGPRGVGEGRHLVSRRNTTTLCVHPRVLGIPAGYQLIIDRNHISARRTATCQFRL
jgi:hypothetical protein